MYMTGTFSPTFGLNFSSSSFICSSVGGFAAVSELLAVMDNLNYSAPGNTTGTPTLIGGLFYFQSQAQGQIVSTTNTFQKCNTTMEGTVFYLYKGQNLIDSYSFFGSNAGVKGQIYCDSCTASFDFSTFNYIVAYKASLVYLKGSSDGLSVAFNNCSIINGYSVGDGGAVAAEGSGIGLVAFKDCGMISYFTAGGNGGFF